MSARLRTNSVRSSQVVVDVFFLVQRLRQYRTYSRSNLSFASQSRQLRMEGVFPVLVQIKRKVGTWN